MANDYDPSNIYNMDETGLYWRKSPSNGLASRDRPGLKKNKTRVSIVFCINARGHDRLHLWVIGNAKTPRALKNQSLDTMGVVWRWNKKAWMTGAIMSEWLQQFYVHVGATRRILLTMDNCSAHIAAAELCPPPANVNICWLPPNATSKYQPLDQGIINSFKAHYRRQWLEFMVQAYSKDDEPMKTVNIKLAIRWSSRAWNHEISNVTVFNCFVKSTLIPHDIIGEDDPQVPLNDLYNQAQGMGRIQDAMSPAKFLNPADETDIDQLGSLTADELLETVIDSHCPRASTEPTEDEYGCPTTIPLVEEALHSLSTVIEFVEGQVSIDSTQLRGLESLERDLLRLREKGKKQQTLDRWFQ